MAFRLECGLRVLFYEYVCTGERAERILIYPHLVRKAFPNSSVRYNIKIVREQAMEFAFKRRLLADNSYPISMG